MKPKNLNFDDSDKRTNWFDDGVLDDNRVRRVIRGRLSCQGCDML